MKKDASTIISVPNLATYAASYIYKSLPWAPEDEVLLSDAQVAEQLGVSVPVYFWALRELEAVGFLTYERKPRTRKTPATTDVRKITVDRRHWLVEAMRVTVWGQK